MANNVKFLRRCAENGGRLAAQISTFNDRLEQTLSVGFDGKSGGKPG